MSSNTGFIKRASAASTGRKVHPLYFSDICITEKRSGDEVIIDLWGNTVRNIRQEITPDGNITIDETGPIYLNGLKIEEAYVRVKNALSNVYASLKDDEPNTFMKLSLGKAIVTVTDEDGNEAKLAVEVKDVETLWETTQV